MTKEPFIILLVVFVLFGLMYSPLKKANLNSKNNGANNSSIGTSKENIDYSSNRDIAKEIKNTEEAIKKLEQNINKEIEKSKRSPYYGKINMSNISGLRGSDPNKEYTSLSVRLGKNETIKITSWYLKSEITGYYAIIGGASLLPFPFSKTESNVVIQNGDRVYLTKGFSPIGISFRTNKCTGYFEENRTFVPSLSLKCPLSKDENLPTFSNVLDRNDECIKIIERIGRCTTKNSEFIRDLPDTVPSACKTYITNQINYNSCVSNHFGDTDFPGDEYRIYLNKFGSLWRTTHDTINLHDENGLIVDTISY
ncbi:MAG: hypothetical protein AAB350_02925 [Patescibacteria group bacterium]